ncbi:serine/threonine-protein kinase-like protein CCR4 [Lycium ferocissimum]|uniref:serine/threonine-protein kinase-like protein CCR4 n=1 Tax=Lycium ferocissimum TaxID=112874 RepID=UPI0028167411|nr:serine/threonine-protein kinase-like protein CCR4 [Lycium ferocissimum]
MAQKTHLFFSLVFFMSLCFPLISCLSTIAISKTSNQTLVCALISNSSSPQESSLNCTSFPQGIQIPLNPSISFTGIVGGNGFLCGLTSSETSIMVCWRFSNNGTNLTYKRIYVGPLLTNLDSGNSHICGIVNGTSNLQCWQWHEFNSSNNSNITSNLAVGQDFVCGLKPFGQIQCLGSFINVTDANAIPSGNYTEIAAGSQHVCAISKNGSLSCWGNIVGEKPVGQFKSLALGDNRSCALRSNGSVFCWGENGFSLPSSLSDTSFERLVAKQDVFCGILTSNFSLFCWGNDIFNSNPAVFNGVEVVPGPCIRNTCPCSPLPNYARFCDQGLMICSHCSPIVNGSGPSPPPSPSQSTGRSDLWNRRNVAFLVVGCVGSLMILSVLIILFLKYCKIRGCRVHDSGRLDESGVGTPPQQGIQTSQVQDQLGPHQTPVLEKRLSQLFSMGNGGHLEEFSLQVLLQATNNFSDEHKVGTGSFGSVYRATLEDGREVAIKRAEASASSSYAGGTKYRQEDKDSAFLNELEFLSRLNHKNLVRLLGYCEDSNERVLIFEYMNNGTLHDHLHRLETSPLTSWTARIKVALDAARGVEYLHEYAVPAVIHRDIKSSNVLLDTSLNTKVSDFGLSLMGPQEDETHLSLRAAGTVGYMDPEYYRLQQLTTKSDVYSFGVMMLELLSGYKAIHKNENGVPRNVVDFVVPYIVQDEIHRVLDRRVPPPTPFEIEAVSYVGYLAADCTALEGRDRPKMTEIVNSLERALQACLATPNFSRSNTDSST